VRELRHAVERSVILSEGKSLEFSDLLPGIPGLDDKVPNNTLNLVDMEKRYILKAIDKHRGNITRAAEELGLERTALYRRIKKHGL
jgi:transcriptional regulator of acetoin/glycerol metabolism